MALLVVLITLAVICGPACGADGCSGFRHLDNGQTFFRYGGLLVIFRCNPGYKLHGHKTNSCVSGHWSRELPVCVGSRCPHPGPLIHGTSNMNEDSSWVVFSCDAGFHLRGPSMLFCKGHIWNGTKPACRESDIMSSASIFSLGKPTIHQNLQKSALKSQQQLDAHPNRAFKKEDIKSDLLSQTQSNMLNSERLKEDKPNTHLKEKIQFDKGETETAQETKRNSSEVQSLQEGTGKVEETNLSSTVSSGMPLDPKPSLPASHKLAVSTVSDISVRQTSHHDIDLASSMTGQLGPVTSQENLSEKEAVVNKNLQAETSFQSSLLHNSQPADKEKSKKQSHIQASASNTASTDPNSTLSDTSSSITLPPDTSTLDLTSLWEDFYNFTLNTTSEPFLNVSRRPLCPYPPVPSHGTFYFRNVENPGPSEFRHYIQYSCYPGYTLAHGDTHSYCTAGGTWSGNTPVCLELTPCSVNNGGCSQICSYSQNQTSNQSRTQCHCRPGFVLLDDGQTCRDLDECVEEEQRCHHSCINTFGSFRCSCNVGYQPAPDQTSCSDVDECLLPAAVSGCMFGCINTPGSFHCSCPDGYSQLITGGQCRDIDECAANEGLGPCMHRCHNLPGSYRCSCMYGHTLAGDGHRCIAECPTGYRKQPNTQSDNSTTHSLKKECVDINECLEEMCEWKCVNLPGSHRCICPRGYTLHTDRRSCKDINECNKKNGGCSHGCVNIRGGYKCSCPASLRLSPYNWKKCLSETMSSWLS